MSTSPPPLWTPTPALLGPAPRPVRAQAPAPSRHGVLSELPPDQAACLLEAARPVSFAAGERIAAEGRRADRLWILCSGTVDTDVHIPCRRPPVVERLGAGALLGWSALLPPYRWQLGATAVSAVGAYELEAARVRELCRRDPLLDAALNRAVATAVARHLSATRERLLGLYGPAGTAA